MPIDPRPYFDHGAWAVFQDLDAFDFLEAEHTRGTRYSSLGLFAEWRAAEGVRFLSHVVVRRSAGRVDPFAVVGLSHTGQAGVAQAAMLSRDHGAWRRELVQLARLTRETLPGLCARMGVRRIECRCWAKHPTAPRFLEAMGFWPEAELPGFGATGAETFLQYVFLPQMMTFTPS